MNDNMSKRKNEDETNESVKIQKLNNEGKPFIAFDQDPSPDIFKLHVFCCNDLFDRLPLKDLHSIGQTCKRLNKIAGQHFQAKYQGGTVRYYDDGIFYCEADGMIFTEIEIEAFSEFLQSIEIVDASLDKFKYVGANCKSLGKIGIKNGTITSTKIDCIKEVLPKIEAIQLENCEFEGDYFGGFLKMFPNLKELTISDCRIGNKWLHSKYSKLEDVSYFNDRFSDYVLLESFQDWQIFFEQNRNVRRFGCDSVHFVPPKDDMSLTSGLEFDRLNVEFHTDFMDEICAQFKQMYEQGFYKKMRLNAHYPAQKDIDAIAALSGIDILSVRIRKNIVWPVMLDVKELHFGLYTPTNTIITETAFPNIERILFNNVQFDRVVPFIKHAKKLKKLNINCVDNLTNFMAELKSANPMDWNKERAKLDGASKLTILVPDAVLTAFKSVNFKTKFNLIEIKSHNGLVFYYDELKGFNWEVIPSNL